MTGQEPHAPECRACRKPPPPTHLCWLLWFRFSNRAAPQPLPSAPGQPLSSRGVRLSVERRGSPVPGHKAGIWRRNHSREPLRGADRGQQTRGACLRHSCVPEKRQSGGGGTGAARARAGAAGATCTAASVSLYGFLLIPSFPQRACFISITRNEDFEKEKKQVPRWGQVLGSDPARLSHLLPSPEAGGQTSSPLQTADAPGTLCGIPLPVGTLPRL